MPVKVLVTVELRGMYDMRRNDLDQEMLNRNWTLFPTSTSTNAYCVEFPELDSDADAVASAEMELDAATKAVGIYDWDAVCVIQDPETEDP